MIIPAVGLNLITLSNDPRIRMKQLRKKGEKKTVGNAKLKEPGITIAVAAKTFTYAPRIYDNVCRIRHVV